MNIFKRLLGINRGKSSTAITEDAYLADGSAKIKIMAIDDEPIILKIIESGLKMDADFLSPISIDGSKIFLTDIILKIEEEKPDIVILDVLFRNKEEGGLELVRAIRNNFDGLPIILLTSALLTEEQIKSLKVQGFVYKVGSSSSILKQKIREVLGKSSSSTGTG
jgi:DNA-binding NarL/FixJ family response regulator